EVAAGDRWRERGRKQSLPAPLRNTEAGNSRCRPPFEIPRPGTVIAGPRSKDRGREESLAAPVRKTAAGNSHWRPPFKRPRPGTIIAGPCSKDRGREQSLAAPVRKTTAGNNHWRPPFEIPRPETVTAGPPCVRHYPPSGLDDYLVQEVFDFPGLIVFKSEYVGDVAFLIQIVGSDDAEFAALCVEHQAFSEVAV